MENSSVKTLGQVFTPEAIAEKMIALIKNKDGEKLEPSCGEGIFLKKLHGCTGIEIDEKIAPKEAINMDFFDYDISNKFDVIIGNPPYVKYQNINPETKEKIKPYSKIFDKRTNLNLFFIYKCIMHLRPHGELIFIVPREFLKATSAIKLNEYIYNEGTITDIIDLGDQRIFEGATPNCIIFRFEKGNYKRKTTDGKTFSCINGQLLFLTEEYPVKFSDLFSVKVGAVSGADKIFENENGNVEFVYSKTRKTGKTKKMFYNIYDESLVKHKEELLDRKIRKFTEKNWYMWGRKYFKSDKERIYVNCKTRNKKPFFYNECKAYDGSMLAIIPKFDAAKEDCIELAKLLNKVKWDELGFVCDGRYIFSQKSLENTVLPKEFKSFAR